MPEKEEKTVIDLLRNHMHRRELSKQKSIWKAFGNKNYYAAEKEKQQAIYEELQRKKKLSHPLPPRGGRHARAFLKELKPLLETQMKREGTVKRLKELALEAHENCMNKNLEAWERLMWARIEESQAPRP